MRRFKSLAYCLTLLFSFLAPGATVAGSSLSVPERLVYEVSWSGLKAGTAVQEVTPLGEELDIVYTVRSGRFLGAFLPIDDRNESILSRGSEATHWMPRVFREKINEGKTHSWKEAQFDQTRLKVDTRDFLKHSEKSEPISSTTYDTLSSVYFLRSSDFPPGRPIQIDIFDCKRLWHAEARLTRQEGVKTPLGRFKTLVVTIELKSEGMKPRPDYMTVWLSDDELRIPVKMVVKMKIGEFTATLTGGSHWARGHRITRGGRLTSGETLGADRGAPMVLR